MVDAPSSGAPRRLAQSLPALSLFVATALSAAMGLGVPGCLERRSQTDEERAQGRCTSCHGDARRAGDELARSAPPRDLSGQHAVGYPGVGAHAAHVLESPTHAGVKCDECHVVPERVDSPGHTDDGAPAELEFGNLARTGAHEPSYDFAKRTCRDSYCHGGARVVWTAPRADSETCGNSCHGVPPPSPHPQSEQCFACHGEVVDAERRFLAPERHVDGVVDFAAGECRLCHGGTSNEAPPPDTSGNASITALGVGAHQAHLRGGEFGRPLECEQCHEVPARVEDPNHLDGAPAEVVMTDIAASHGHSASWVRSQATCNETWCHSPSAGSGPSPRWDDEGGIECSSCHEFPPPSPHPQLDDCSSCHGEIVASDDRTLLDTTRHVDGTIDVDFDAGCTACHGQETPAPPRDLSGNTQTSAPGVGAHQTHVLGTERSRAVPCGECHSVPSDALAPGHLDSAPPAEVVFAGAAAAYGGSPRYEDGSCRETSCHGGAFPEGHDSGGALTVPFWTEVGGSQAECGSCHAIPPPPPHPNPHPCHLCHGNIAEDGITFTRPDLHVDGRVTLRVE